jgi:phage tail tape-measure protein
MQTNLERFRSAALVLAGCGPVKQRLAQAFHAHLGTIATEELPRELRERYSMLASALHSSQRTGTLDSVSASILKMSESQACQHAQSIVLMFSSLHEAMPVIANRPATLLRAVPDEQEIPAFLNRA